jgi:transposase-like protein
MRTNTDTPQRTRNPILRAQYFADEIIRTRDMLSTLAEARADSIRDALDAGMTQADVARALGITPQAVHNLLRQH